MFGKSQTSLRLSETSRPNLPSIGHRFLIESPVKKTDCLSVSELSVFRGLNIRNQWGYTNTNTRMLSLLKKACDKQASISALRIRSRSGGVAERGPGGHKRPLIWGVYAGNVVREHEGVCEANGFPVDEGPCGRSLGVPLDTEQPCK